jgi:hypothetical protein
MTDALKTGFVFGYAEHVGDVGASAAAKTTLGSFQ